MKQLLLLALLALPAWAMAEKTSLPVANESWAVQFESPALKQVRSESTFKGYSYMGNAGKLNGSSRMAARSVTCTPPSFNPMNRTSRPCCP